MKLSANRSGFKLGIAFFLGLSVFAFAANAGWLQIPASIDNVIQVIQRILVTDDGTQTGNPVMDINTGGNVIVYGPLLDSAANPYLTGESDPVWNADKAGYYTKTQIDDQNFLVSEIDPFWAAEKSGYYSKLEIEAKGYLTNFTELDSIFVGSDAYNVTSLGIANWNTAFGRGSHALVGYLTGESDPDWNSVKSDYYTKAQIDATVGGLAGGLTYKGSWDYSTGALPSDITTGDLYVLSNEFPDNGLPLHMEAPDQIIANKTRAGQSLPEDWDVIENDYAEQDPLYSASIVAGITALQVSGWDEAHARGDHSLAGYLTNESDPIWSGDKANYYTKSAIDAKGYLTGYVETDPVFGASSAHGITNTNITNWNSAYSRGDHRLMGYLTGTSMANYYTISQINAFGFLTGASLSNYYTKTQVDNAGFITGYTETDPQVGTLEAGKGCYSTGGQVVCNQDFTYNESDPVFMANSGNYYPTSNPAGYITGVSNLWNVSGSDIISTNTGNIFLNNYLNIGANTNAIYPLYVRADNTDDIYSNYITIDGPDTVEKGFQIGGGATSEDYKRAMYIASGDDGDKLYFANGNSNRDVLTLAAGGRVGFNLPTDLGTTIAPDGFSIYPQYFDSVMRYDGNDYYDNTVESHSSVGDSFVILSDADDTLLVGKDYPWRATYIGLDVAAGTPGTLAVKYSKEGGTWNDVVGLTDTTNRFTRNGNISWSLSSFFSTWEKRTIDGQNLYWIQISLSSLGTAPTARIITNLGVNRFALYAAASDVNPMLAMDSEARFGILPPELTGKYEMGKLPGLTTTQMEVVSNSVDRSDILTYIATDETGAGAAYLSARSRGTVDNKTAVADGDVLGGLFGFGYDGATFRDAANIVFGVDGTPDVMDMPGKISFYTTPDGDETALERMTIKNTGRVGIGTTLPSQLLTVSGNINVTTGYHVYDGNGSPYVTASSLGIYLTGESDPVWLTEKTGYYTKTEIDNKPYLTGESDPVFMANSGDYYLASNPNNYISASTIPRTIGADITNTNTGEVHINTNLFTSGHINIGANTNTTYPLYVWATNTGDHYPNYITIDGPNTINKGFQIGGVTSKHDFERSMHTHANEDGDKLYFQNGNSVREVLTMAGGGATMFNFPTALGITTPADAMSLYPQYFDYVARYDGDTYYDYTADAYISKTDPFVVVSDDEDVFLLGKEYPRRSMYIDIDTPAGTPGTLQVKYSKAGGTWGDVVGLSDTTNKLKQDGSIGWTLSSFKSTWEKREVNGQNLYWIQVSLSSLGGNAPTAKFINNMGVNRFSIYGSAGDASPMFTVDANSRVGLLPPELSGRYEMGKLPGITSTKMEVVSNDNDQYTSLHYLADPVDDESMNIAFAKSKGTVDIKLPVTIGDILGSINSYGYDGATFRSAASIMFGVDGTPDVMDMPGKISFFTTPDGDETSVERMTIKNTGRVGIGTTLPSQLLTVSGNINVTNGYDVYDGAGNAYVTMADLSGLLIEENDPIWSLDKPSYYTSLQVDNLVAGFAGGLTYQGTWDYSTGVLPADVDFGDMYVIVASGDYNGLELHGGDQIIANTGVVGVTTTGDWDIIETYQAETDPVFSASSAFGISATNISHWNTAYGRGNHATMGYITGYTETDPDFTASVVHGITSGNISNRTTAYSRGNHADAGYLMSYTETDPVWSADAINYYTKTQIDAKGYLTGANLAPYVLLSQTGNWNTAYSRGDHATMGYITGGVLYSYLLSSLSGNWNTAYSWIQTNSGSALSFTTNSGNYYTKSAIDAKGYLTGYTETDPDFTASVAHGITNTNVSNWNSAYSRGNHATMGYITSYTETDPVRSAASTNYYTKAQITGFQYITGGALTPYVLLSLTGNWNTAYNWIQTNSGSALSFSINSGNYYTKTEIDNKGYLTGGLGYTLQVQAPTSNPTDSQTIYFGYLPAAPTTTAAIRKVYISKAGTIKAADIYSYSSTAGGNNAWSMYIRKNNTTDTLIATVSLSANERKRTNTGLSIAVAVGDYIEIKLVNPAFANPNPSGTIFGGYVYIE